MSDYKVLEYKDGCISSVKCNGVIWTDDGKPIDPPLTREEKSTLDTFAKLVERWRRKHA